MLMCISDVHVGKIDATLLVDVDPDGDASRRRSLVVPFELKTGKRGFFVFWKKKQHKQS
jgi:hypothetical protein